MLHVQQLTVLAWFIIYITYILDIAHFHTSLPNPVLTYTQEIPLAQYFQQEEFLQQKWELSSSDSHMSWTAFRGSQEGSLSSKESLDKKKTVKVGVSTGHGCKEQQRQSVPCPWGEQRHLFGGLPKEILLLGKGNCLRIKCLGTSYIQRKPNIASRPYRMLTSLQDPLCPGVSQGLPSHLIHKLGFVRIAPETAKALVTCSSSLLYDVLHYFPSLFQSSSWEVAPAPFLNIGFNYLEEGL